MLGPHVVDKATGKNNPICISAAHDDHTMIVNLCGAIARPTTKYHGLLNFPCSCILLVTWVCRHCWDGDDDDLCLFCSFLQAATNLVTDGYLRRYQRFRFNRQHPCKWFVFEDRVQLIAHYIVINYSNIKLSVFEFSVFVWKNSFIQPRRFFHFSHHFVCLPARAWGNLHSRRMFSTQDVQDTHDNV